MPKKQFNFGFLAAVNIASLGRGSFSIHHINGLHHAVRRGVVIPGTVVSGLPLSITDENENPVSYPVHRPFNALGIAEFRFKWDASGLPITMAAPGNGQVATSFRYSAQIPGSQNVPETGNLLWFSNVSDVERLSDHAKIPEVAIAPLRSVLTQAVGIARPMYSVINPVSRASLAAVVLLK